MGCTFHLIWPDPFITTLNCYLFPNISNNKLNKNYLRIKNRHFMKTNAILIDVAFQGFSSDFGWHRHFMNMVARWRPPDQTCGNDLNYRCSIRLLRMEHVDFWTYAVLVDHSKRRIGECLVIYTFFVTILIGVSRWVLRQEFEGPVFWV